MKPITVHMPEAYLAGLDEIVKQGLAPNRSEAIRVAVRDYLKYHNALKRIQTDINLENIEH